MRPFRHCKLCGCRGQFVDDGFCKICLRAVTTAPADIANPDPEHTGPTLHKDRAGIWRMRPGDNEDPLKINKPMGRPKK